MLGWVDRQVRDAQIAGVGLVLTLASAIVGIVWMSIALAQALSSAIGSTAAAALLTGAAFLLPAIMFLVWRGLETRRRQREQDLAHTMLGAQPDLLAALTRIAQDMAERAPLAAVAIATLGGLLAARFPAALPLLVQALTRDDAQPTSGR